MFIVNINSLRCSGLEITALFQSPTLLIPIILLNSKDSEYILRVNLDSISDKFLGIGFVPVGNNNNKLFLSLDNLTSNSFIIPVLFPKGWKNRVKKSSMQLHLIISVLLLSIIDTEKSCFIDLNYSIASSWESSTFSIFISLSINSCIFSFILSISS